jgi:hypothetical protein
MSYRFARPLAANSGSAALAINAMTGYCNRRRDVLHWSCRDALANSLSPPVRTLSNIPIQ